VQGEIYGLSGAYTRRLNHHSPNPLSLASSTNFGHGILTAVVFGFGFGRKRVHSIVPSLGSDFD
jgi:hypothetical protein